MSTGFIPPGNTYDEPRDPQKQKHKATNYSEATQDSASSGSGNTGQMNKKCSAASGPLVPVPALDPPSTGPSHGGEA
jgi:hypothetical protein